MFLTYHSFSQLILYGWGYEKSDPPNVNELRTMGNIAAAAIKQATGRNYVVGGAAKLLYEASGQ